MKKLSLTVANKNPRGLFPMGSRDGAMARGFTSHQCVSDSIPAECHMWVEFVVGSCHTLRVFLQVLQVPPSIKATSSNPNLARIEDPHEN